MTLPFFISELLWFVSNDPHCKKKKKGLYRVYICPYNSASLLIAEPRKGDVL